MDMVFSRLAIECIVAKLSTAISQMEEKLASAKNKEYSNWLTIKSKLTGLSLRKSKNIRSKVSNAASLSMVKKRQASSGDSTSGEMIRIGYLYDRRTIVLLTKKVRALER